MSKIEKTKQRKKSAASDDTLDLQSFEREIVLRPLSSSDYEQVVQIQQLCFPKMPIWTKEQFESQLERFPEGQVGIEYRGELVASSSSLIVDFDLYSDWHDWKVMSDSGYIRNHSAKGDTLYGIEIMVSPRYRGMKLARRLYDERKEICRRKNLIRMIVGGRIPGYREHQHELTAREYVERVKDKSLYDPVLTTQLANGFQVIGLIPEYLPSDEDSAGWASHLEWLNIDYVSDSQRRLLTSRTQVVRVAAVQYQMRSISKFEEFAQQVEFFLDVARDYRSDFIVYPELFTLQLLSLHKSMRPGEAARAMSEYTPQLLKLFTKLAVAYNVNIVAGSHFIVENERLLNASFFFHRNGLIDRQIKVHITPAEKRWWGVRGGDSIEVIETDQCRVAIAICYDIEFPELCRVAARKGAQILFCPFNTDERQGFLRVNYCARARAIENHLYVVTAGCTGNLPFVENADIHYAQSGVYTPCDVSFPRDGVGAECTPNIETIVMHDLDIELLRKHRYQGTTLNWKDRRKDLYSVHFRNKDTQVII